MTGEIAKTLRRLCGLLLWLGCVAAAPAANAAPPAVRDSVIAGLDRGDCVRLKDGVNVCRYDFVSGGDSVEAISFRPAGEGKFPAILLIPDHAAREDVPLGTLLAAAGFACVAISQPGFGRSQGKPDFVGPNTLRVLTDGLNRFSRESFVDSTRLGLFGLSRGALAASLLAERLANVQGAVLAGGIYDVKKAWDELNLHLGGTRSSLKTETGMSAEAIKERSSILEMQNLKCPVLILHGEDDQNAPVTQALLLRDKLDALKKPYDIRIMPVSALTLDMRAVQVASLDFFKRTLSAAPEK